jgi:hypothetical protein
MDRRYCGVWTRSSRGWVSYFSMVGYRHAVGLYTLLTDPDLVGHNLLKNLCKGLVESLCSHTSIGWYGA